ncbi:MAG: AAA family ATPase [Dermatophilaceae bacterium]
MDASPDLGDLPPDLLEYRAQWEAHREAQRFADRQRDLVAGLDLPPAPEIEHDGPAVDPDEPEVPIETRLVVPYAEIDPKGVDWLWEGRIPLGVITVLQGDPKVGKSTLWVEIAAHVSTGTPWPDGSACPKGNVIVLSVEDMAAQTIRPRLDAAGADVHRVGELQAVVEYGTDGNGDPTVTWRLANLGDLSFLERAVTEAHASLLVVDVLMGCLPGKVDSYRDQDIRSLLGPLAKMAEKHRLSVLLLRHLIKGHGGNALYGGGGSIGISGAARSILTVARDADDPSRRNLACISNLAEERPVLAYTLENDPARKVGRVQWQGEAGISSDDILNHDEDRDVPKIIEGLVFDNGGSALMGELRLACGPSVGDKTIQRALAKLGYKREPVRDKASGNFKQWRVYDPAKTRPLDTSR